MENFRREFEELIVEIMPLLKDKIQIGAVDEQTRTPFSVYSMKEEPIRTKMGIVGLRKLLTFDIYSDNSKALEKLKYEAIKMLDKKDIAGMRIFFSSSEYGFYSESKVPLHAYSLIFNIK